MLQLARIIVLYTLCTAANAVIFNYTLFQSIRTSANVVDFEKVHLTSIEDDNMMPYYYLEGPIYLNHNYSNANGKVGYVLRQVNGDDTNRIPSIPDNIVPFCDFNFGFVQNYTRPMSENHSNFVPIKDSDCMLEKGTYSLFSVDDVKTLSAPSQLPAGDYYLNLWFLNENYSPIGGYISEFTVIDDM